MGGSAALKATTLLSVAWLAFSPPDPEICFDLTLRLAGTALTGIARHRDMIVASWRRSAKFLARSNPPFSPFAWMVHSFLEAAAFDSDFSEKRLEFRDSHGFDEPRNKSFDKYESFSGR